MTELEIFQPEFTPIHLGGRVYRVSDTNAAKIVEESDIEEIIREEKIGKLFYNEGIAVPKPEGIYRIPRKKGIFFERTFFSPSFVREYLEGTSMSNLSREDFKKALDNIYDQLEQAKKVGFDAWDLHFSNFLWVPSKNKTYLIDLDSFGEIEGRGSK